MTTRTKATATARDWTLRLLGTPALLSPRGEEHLLEPRAAALLALAALEPGVSRGRAATLLWPDSEPAHARQALRQQLLRLRKLGASDLLCGQGTLRLAAHVKHDAGGGSPGTLLGAFDYDGEALAQWVAGERERLQRDAAGQLARTLAEAEAAGDLEGALPIAQRLLAAHPDSERAHRNLMRLHYLLGDVGQAQTAYERLRAMLERELAAAPSPETEQLARTIRSAHGAPAAALSAPPPAVLRPPRLIGRERERRVLEECWSAPMAAIVTGVGGIGKTRLVTDFAAARGAVAVVAARPGDAPAAYSLLARMVRALLARGAPLPEALRGELARLLPELGRAPPIRDDADRDRLLRAVDALLALCASHGLAGVVLDDLHYADAASLEALLGRIAGGIALRWILASRGDEMGAQAHALAEALVAAGAARQFDLAPLAQEQVRELLDSLELPGIDGARLAPGIARHAGGNPLFVLETVKALLLEAPGDGARVRLPAAASVTALIARRLGRLSAPALRLARCAAVAGQDFSADLAAHVLGVRPLDLADAWAELEHAHVLRDGAFEHDLVHEAASGSVPAAIARRLHAEIAAFLEAAGTEAARVAGHWAAARRPKEAGAAFLKAAARARDAGRRVEEAELLDQAAGCFERCGDAGGRFEALLARAEALICNDLGEATLAAVHAAENAARDDDERMRALLILADYLGHHDADAAVRVARTGIALATKAKRADLALHFSVHVAGGLCELRRVDEALAMLEPMRELAGSLAPRTCVEFLLQLGIAMDLANRLGDALEVFEAARAIAQPGGHKDLLASVLSNLATTTSKRGELERAVEFGRQGLHLWRESELLRGTPLQTQALLAHRLRDLGHYDEAIAMLEEAVEGFEKAGARAWMFSAAHRLALAYAHMGQHARAMAMLAADPTDLPVKAQAMWMAHRGEVARLAGGAALEPIRAALSMLGDDVDDGNNRLVGLFAAAVLPAAEGESIATATAAWSAARERFGMAIAAHVRAAECALAQGALDRARPQVEAALRLFTAHQPDNFYRAELWWVAARVFRAADRGAQADRMLADGRQWVLHVAERHVRAEYRDSFLHRNPINRALLAASRHFA